MRVLYITCMFLGMLWFGNGEALPAQGAIWGVRPDGRPVVQLAKPGSPAVLLFFVAADCPISNRTFPEMKRLREEFANRESGKREVPVWFVYPNEGETPGAVQKHQEAFDYGGEAVLDTAGRLTRLAGAIVTPEVAVLTPDLTSKSRGGWKPVYVGRIDNRYVRLGLERPAATEHFAEDAVRAVVAKRVPNRDPGRPVGCAIVNRSWQTGGSVR